MLGILASEPGRDKKAKRQKAERQTTACCNERHREEAPVPTGAYAHLLRIAGIVTDILAASHGELRRPPLCLCVVAALEAG